MDPDTNQPQPERYDDREAAVRAALARPDFADVMLQCLTDGVRAAVADDAARLAARAAE